MSRRRPSALEEFSGINVTPLMDLTFLLLIVFMITAPMLEYSVDVSPPPLDAARIDETINILINLTRTGEVIVEEQRVNTQQLTERLSQFFSTRPDAAVLIRGHEDRPYGEVIGLMRVAKRVGFQTVSLVTQAEEE